MGKEVALLKSSPPLHDLNRFVTTLYTNLHKHKLKEKKKLIGKKG